MSVVLKLGLINIDLMLINTQNSRYSTTGTHRFSKCCKAKVKNKMYCEDCGKDILSCDLLYQVYYRPQHILPPRLFLVVFWRSGHLKC